MDQVLPTLPRKRRWYQFSLRTLSIAVVVVSVALGLFAIRLQRARKQAAAVALIEKAEGSVCYDYEVKRDRDGSWLWVDGSRSPIPAAFLPWPGRDFFHDVKVADLRDDGEPSAADVRGAVRAMAELPQLEQIVVAFDSNWALEGTDLRAIAECQRLTELSLWGDAVSDDSLQAISQIAGLRVLELSYTRVTDRGLGQLRALGHLEQLGLSGLEITGEEVSWPPSLKKIDLSDSAISSSGLATLADCRYLEQLNLMDTHVTDAGLAHLSSLPKLRRLSLDRTPITDDGLAHLGKLPFLRELSLSRVKISSDGAKHLKNLPSLESLDLSGTFVDGEFTWPAGLIHVNLDDSCITDKGLQRLAECPKLQSASLGGRNLATADGEKAFREARPDVDTSGF